MSANFTPELNSYTDLTPFRYWCQKVLPLVYDDSLSYYELLCKVVDYLNKTMEDVNLAVEDVGKLHDAYDSLQTYVNTYFDNLDVQEEINNKLDEMVEDGTLRNIFSEDVHDILDVASEAAQQAIADIPENVTDWLEEHITQETGYVIDDTLTVQGAAADAKKTGDEISALKSDLNDIEDNFISGKNLLNPDATTVGFISAADGRIDYNQSYLTSDFIPISANQSLTISPNCRKFLAYDATRTAIQSTYVNAGSTGAYTYTANADGFIRITYLATNTTEQVENGTSATDYEAFYKTLAPSIKLSDTQKAEIHAITDPIAEDVTEIEASLIPIENDIDNIKEALIEETSDLVVQTTVTKSNDNTGYINQNGAIDTSSTSYYFSDYIPVKAGDKITAQTVGGTPTNLRYVAAYDSDHTIDNTKGWNNSTQSLDPFVIQSGIAYIRVTLYVTQRTTQIVKVTTPDGKSEYYAKTTFTPVLDGKKWVACGDSFTQGDFSGLPATDFQYQSGKYVGKNKVYPYVIGLRTNAEIVNEAISGSTIAYVDGNRNEFSTPNGRYTQIPSDADYITLYFGINDSHQNVPIGTIDDNVNTTFYGAWNIVMQYLIANHPDAKIGIVISNGCDTIDYPNAEIAIAKKYGVAYLDMNSDYKVPILFRVNGKPDTDASVITVNYEHYRVSSTNGHPNVKMHEYESTIIQKWLESM